MQAPQILQLYLDEISAAVLRGDYAAYRARVCLPYQLVSHLGSQHLTTEAELRQGFDRFVEVLRIRRITDYVRLVEGAERLDDALLTGRYITHLMAGAQRVIPPFRSAISLRLDGARWCGASVTNPLANSRWPGLGPAVSEIPSPKGPADV